MIKRILMLGLTVLITVASGSSVAHAQSVPYEILKDGSNQQSYASAYFVNPADVTVANGQYHVAISVATTHDLGSFPVTVGSVAGQAPAISKRSQGNTDYYTFSFTTSNLSNLINGTMHVDVDALNYHHDYGFGLKFNSASLPQLTPTPKAAAAPTTSPAAQSSSVNNSSAMSSSVATASSSADKQSSSTSSQSSSESSSSANSASNQSSADASSNNSSSALTSSGNSSSSKQPVVTTKAATKTAPSFLQGATWMYAAGGVIGGGILVGLLLLLKKH